MVVDDDGTIVSIGERKDFDPASLELYEGIICPGFINAHCHLELSYMKEKIPEKKGIAQFIIDLIDYRNSFLSGKEEAGFSEAIVSAINAAENEMIRNGIVGMGDISNNDFTFLSKSKSALQYHTFVECFGFFPEKADQYFQQSLSIFEKALMSGHSASITPHAPYSVPPELFQKIFSFTKNAPAIFSYHNQESQAESDFFKSGSGDFLNVFQHFKLPLSIFNPTGKNSLQSVINYFPIRNKTLFVHNTFSSKADIAIIRKQLPNAYFCFCPNANLYIEQHLPNFSLFEELSDRICIGTDSYASNHQLSILEEIKTIQKYYPALSTAELIKYSTLNGAEFFGWDKQLGSIEAGKKPGLNLITECKAFQLTEKTLVRKIA